MKKILIVNNNMDMGGIQKSLLNLLKAIHHEYEVTLLLFSQSGSLLQEVPKGVKVISPQRQYCMMGLTKEELKKYPFLFLFKAFLTKVTALFSRRKAMRLLGLFQRKIKGYDAVISYSHLFHHKYFANGCGDFVLDKTDCQNKICLVHCDYMNSGCMSKENNAEYLEFNKIACCSESVKERFLQGSGIGEDKVFTLRNCYDLDILELSKECPYGYDDSVINIVSVARLSHEKGIGRAIEALRQSKRKDIRYYIIGNGPQREALIEKTKEYCLEKQVFLLGEQKNPYGYMVHGDYLLVPSLHEAAPMVFDEAKVLGLPVITTNTTSAAEMVGEKYGIVCENSVDGLADAVLGLAKKKDRAKRILDNRYQQEQFLKIVN